VSGNIRANRLVAGTEGGDGGSSQDATAATAGIVVAHRASALNESLKYPIEAAREFAERFSGTLCWDIDFKDGHSLDRCRSPVPQNEIRYRKRL
jgi:hypothetical protein